MEALAELVETSIVQSSNGAYGLLEVVREYARELPSADRTACGLHAAYFLELAERAEPELAGARQGEWLEALEVAHDDLRSALDWFAEEHELTSELRLATALGRFWYIRGYLSEGLSRLRQSASRDERANPELRAKALRSASALAVLRGDYPQARTLVEQALELYRNLGDGHGTVRAWSNLGAILHGLGRLDEAATTLDECVAAADSLGDARLIALARNNRGDVALSLGDYETARREFGTSLALLRELDDVANVARSLYNLGAVALEQDRDADARALLVEALELSDSVEDKEDIAWCLIALANVGAREDGEVRSAAIVLGFARALLERINATNKPFEQHLHDTAFGLLSMALGREELEGLLDEGSRLSQNEGMAIARSLGLDPDPQATNSTL